MSFVLVSFHAHPDDEALLTAGTLARAAAEGHRVVLVTATDGEAGLTSPDLAAAGALGTRRRAELAEAAAALGVARVVHLGLPDSGFGDSATGDPGAFSALDPAQAAAPLVEVLREEGAHVLTTYDPSGGYGHPDHKQVHAVGAVAARLAGTPSVLQATVPRDLLVRGARLARAARLLDASTLARLGDAYCGRDEITHRVDVSAYTAAKRAALQAHASQAVADGGTRTLRLLLGLPGWLFDRVLRYEWYVDPAGAPGRVDDVFAAVR
ncbi:PIG-L family deacetylase [Kineosporia sp. R_H_3]|uniref:PIG-L family deacetylase n=1 Tax=Kineosporia sp. R_H_3 TaxID=1961848 RepID=UPI000B4A9505|nr:PIG-L family deacetylase [Kineosporia sp. R_H_3]